MITWIWEQNILNSDDILEENMAKFKSHISK